MSTWMRGRRLWLCLLVWAALAACFPGPLPPLQPDATDDGDGVADVDVAPVVDVDDGADLPTDATDATELDGDSEVVATNACGGSGPVGPGEAGEACGPCHDGEWTCDPSDLDRRTTFCAHAGVTDTCGGCGLAHPLGDSCGSCGTYGCDPVGSGAVVCVEPDDGCPDIITCEALDCASASRACIETSGDVDAHCGDCLATHVLVAGACVPRLVAPSNVSASTDRSVDVEVTWNAVATATGYRVYRCSTSNCANIGAWSELTDGAITERSWSDTTAAAPGQPSATTNVQASRSEPESVEVTWDSVTAPQSTRYHYRVTSVGAAGESDPSSVVEGARAERPVVGYEIEIDGGLWSLASGGLVTTWSDPSASPPTLTAGSATASLGTFPGFVRLGVSGAHATAGASRSYRVRAITAYGPAPASQAVDGWRVAGALTYQWERSADASADGFAMLEGADSASFDDDTAPADGGTRWYRIVVGASGADAVAGDPVAGARQGPPGVPGGVRASRDRPDRVTVQWQPVADAIGYHVYRDDTKLTTGTGVTTTSFDDVTAPAPPGDWAAPTAVAASTNETSQVTIQWTAPVQPIGADVSYRVSAVNASGEGALSTESEGRRAGLALIDYEIEVTLPGSAAAWISTGSASTTSWPHTNAPAGSISLGTITASQGTYLAWIHLAATGAVATPGADVAYRVRGVLQGGASFTPTSATKLGHRSVGNLTYQWQRSSGASATDFSNLANATSELVDDTAAPNDGTSRWYRLSLAATGATGASVGPVEGWRMAFAKVSAGQSRSCAITTRGALWCWGDGGPPAAVSLPADLGIPAEVGIGAAHTCVRSGSGAVWCWGDNTSGQLGDGTNDQHDDPVQVVLPSGAVSLAASGNWTCVALANGNAECWGSNSAGNLGNNTNSNSNAPVLVLKDGSNSLSGVLAVATGGSHSCARTAAGAWCWGLNGNGQLGNNGTTSSSVAVPVSGVTGAQEIALGNFHTCARLTSGVQCWGANASGQLGNNSTSQSPTAVQVWSLTSTFAIANRNSLSCALTVSNEAYCWGTGYGSVPTKVAGLATPTAIASKTAHTCVVDGYAVRCWGSNTSKQLGDGTTNASSTPVSVQFP